MRWRNSKYAGIENHYLALSLRCISCCNGGMKTSSFYLYDGPGRISIARTAPRRVKAGFKLYRPLNPGAWRSEPAYQQHEAYRERYFREVLGPLDPQRVWDELHRLAGGDEPVLLCHEHLLKSGDWCHRRLVAEWFAARLDVDVPELQTEKHRARDAQLPLF